MKIRAIAAVVAVTGLALVATGCGSSDSDSDATPTETAAEAGDSSSVPDDATEETTAGSEETPAATDEPDEESEESTEQSTETSEEESPESSASGPNSTVKPTEPARGPEQTIDFPPLGEDHVWPDNSAPLSASASSGLPVEYRIEDDSGVCILDGGSVRVEQLGGCNVVASQPGNSEFDPAPDVVQPFYVGGHLLTVQITGLPSSASFASTPTIPFSVIVNPTVDAPFEAEMSMFTVGDCFADFSTDAPVSDSTPQRFVVELTPPNGASGSCTVSAQATGQYVRNDATTVTFVVEP